MLLNMAPTDWKKRLPMIATYSRIAFVPPIVLAYFLISHPASWILMAVLFVLASITDFLDGYWARLYKAESNEGRLMDPIADKILVLAALVLLLESERVDAVMVILFLSRDIFIGGVRSVAAIENIVISAKSSGKWKTALQMTAIPCLMINSSLWNWPLGTIGYYLLWLSVLLSLISGYQYFSGYKKGLSFK